MPLPLYGERELWVIPIRASYPIHEGNVSLTPMGSSLWLGILTSISPCPLATNIAAISFIGSRLGNTRRVILSGFLYTVGRMIAYLSLGILTVAGIMSIQGSIKLPATVYEQAPGAIADHRGHSSS